MSIRLPVQPLTTSVMRTSTPARRNRHPAACSTLTVIMRKQPLTMAIRTRSVESPVLPSSFPAEGTFIILKGTPHGVDESRMLTATVAIQARKWAVDGGAYEITFSENRES